MRSIRSSVPRAAPPSSGRPATKPATRPTRWRSPRTARRRWAWWTRSSASRSVAPTVTTSKWPPSSNAPWAMPSGNWPTSSPGTCSNAAMSACKAMGASTTPRPRRARLTQAFAAAMQAFGPALPLAVGLSGGADSSALLLACARRWPGQVQALHVHHGLQAAADGFEQHCAALCQRLQVPLMVQHLRASPAPGQSPEDAARQARYQALATLAQANQTHAAIKSIAIGQHADDQAETVLLALLRGAGVAGLAAMPAPLELGGVAVMLGGWELAGLPWHRPLLQVTAADVRQWLRAQGQTWVEDPSNADQRLTRNRIRAQLMPALDAASPTSRDTFARSAANAAQAAQLLETLAQQDQAQVGRPPQIGPLQGLSRARQANVLRHWLRNAHHTTPAAAKVNELVDEMEACTRRGHRIHIKVGRGFVVRCGPQLDWYNS